MNDRPLFGTLVLFLLPHLVQSHLSYLWGYLASLPRHPNFSLYMKETLFADLIDGIPRSEHIRILRHLHWRLRLSINKRSPIESLSAVEFIISRCFK